MEQQKEEGGKKYDGEKPRTDLLSTLAMEEVAKVLAFGAKKYDAHNWRRGMSWSRLLGALLRHTFAFMRGQDYDGETGLSHMAHAMCCSMFLLEYHLVQNGSDDRWDESRKMPCSERGNAPDSRGERGSAQQLFRSALEEVQRDG